MRYPISIRAALIAAVVAAAPCALAQDTGGQAGEGGSKGTVVKGKAPVAKDLLKVRFPRPKEFTLSNGVKIYVLEDHRASAVRMSLTMKAGGLFEPKPGVAEMTASMLTEGTKTRSDQEIAAETEGMGAQLSASAGSDRATLSTAGLAEDTDKLIALMSDVLLNPSFPNDRLDRHKFQGSSSIAQRRSNAQSLAAEESERLFYGGTPFARLSPTADQITAVTREDLETFHDKYFRPNGAVLGITGDVNAKEIVDKLEAALSSWKPAPTTPDLPKAEPKPKEATKIYLIDRPGSAQTILQFGNIAVSRTDPDYIPLVVANRILGGGSSGRLFQNIREDKGYTYGAYSNLSAGKWPGIWGASASVRTAVTQPAAAEFFKEFDRLVDQPVPEEELARAKRSLVGGFARTLESPDGILGRSLELVDYGLPMDYWDTYPQKVQAVTAADVQRVARKYLGKGRIQLIAVGERKEIEEGLKKLGPVEIVDPNTLTGGAGGRGRRGR